jgi:hypothetical protein
MAYNESAPRTKATIVLSCIAAAVVLVLLNWRRPFLRLEPAYLNNVVFGVTCLSPWLAVYLVGRLPHAAARIALRTIFICAGVVLFPLAMGSLMGSGWSDLGTIETGRHIVKLYETNCGAPCSFGVAVRQERRLIPGVVLVRDLYGFYPAAWPTYTVINPDSIRVEVPAYGGRAPARSRTYRLYDLP